MKVPHPYFPALLVSGCSVAMSMQQHFIEATMLACTSAIIVTLVWMRR